MIDAFVREVDRDIRDRKFVKLLEISASNFANLLFYGKINKLFTDFLIYKRNNKKHQNLGKVMFKAHVQ